MHVLGELVDEPREPRVLLEQGVDALVVGVGLDLLEGGLAVLADHHEGRQEDGLERDDQRQCWPRALLEHQHPQREQHGVEVDEVHRARERGDLVGDAKLGVAGPLLPLGDDSGMVRDARVEGPGAEEVVRRPWLLL